MKVMQYDGVHATQGEVGNACSASDRGYRYSRVRVKRRCEVFKASAPGPRGEAQTAAGRVGAEVLALQGLIRSGKPY